MRLTISTSGGQTVENAWNLVGNVVWSGDKQRAARTLTFDLAASEADPNLPAAPCPVGAIVSLWDDSGTPLFQGEVVTISLSDREAVIPVTVHDRGMFLAGNDGTVKIRDETAEDAVSRICKMYEIPVGELASTKVPLRRKFTATPLWSIVTTLYTMAAQQTGEQYLARFEWDRLTVRTRSEQGENLIIRPRSNLITTTTTESIENMRNSVGIYDKDGNRLATVQNESAVAIYGLLEEHITQRDSQDAQGEARQILEERGYAQTLTVQCVGDTSLTTGRTVVVQAAEHLSGVFWIDSDTHRWSAGNYTTDLTLNLRNVMYQAEAGSDLE